MWRPNPFTFVSLGTLLADQALDLLIEFAIPEGMSHMLIPGRLGITRPIDPSNSVLDTSQFFVVLAIIIVPFLWWYKRRINYCLRSSSSTCGGGGPAAVARCPVQRGSLEV